MRSPVLDAFKSLKEISDEVVAKEKRIIKEDLDEKELVKSFNIPKIESTFTASNLYEGLDTVDEVELKFKKEFYGEAWKDEELLEDPEVEEFSIYLKNIGPNKWVMDEDRYEEDGSFDYHLATEYFGYEDEPKIIEGSNEKEIIDKIIKELSEGGYYFFDGDGQVVTKCYLNGTLIFDSFQDLESYGFGPDGKSLDEALKRLDEKLPKDLAKAYRKVDRKKIDWSGDDRRQSRVDYEVANYEEITPEQAIQARKDGRIQDLRILKDDQLIVYREDGYPLSGIDWVEKEDRFINRNGKEVKDTRLMPPSHVFKIADKIYLTDEKDHRFAPGKWVKDENGESNYVYDDPTQQARVQQRKDMIPDTGSHSKERKGSYGTPEYYEKSAKEYESTIEEKEKELEKLEDKWEAGDISRNDYQEKKDELNKSIEIYKKYAEDAKASAIRSRGAIATKAAEDRYALARGILGQNIQKYKDLKYAIADAEYDLKRAQERGGEYRWNLKGGSYDEKVAKINSLKKQMEEIQKQLDKLQSEATDELKQANLEQNTKALNDAQKKVDDFKAELDALLSKAHRASGKEESLNEDLVNLNDVEEAKEEKEKLDKEKDELPVEQIVDPSATIVDDLKDSYIGYAILSCPTCKEFHYVKPEELVKAEEATKDGEFLYNVEEECAKCGATGGFELVGQVAKLEDETESEDTKEEPVEEKPEETSEVEVEETEGKEEVEEGLTDFDEVSFDSHVTKYLTEVYDNVESYTSTDGSNTNEGIIIEGLIKFKSGREKPTTFKLSLEGSKMNGLNEAFSEDSNIYTIEGKIENNSFITENIIYKYNIGDELIEGCTKVNEVVKECPDFHDDEKLNEGRRDYTLSPEEEKLLASWVLKKSKEWDKPIEDKKSILDIIFDDRAFGVEKEFPPFPKWYSSYITKQSNPTEVEEEIISKWLEDGLLDKIINK